MNTMELEPIDFLTNYSYFFQQSHEFGECSLTNSCSSLSENSSQNSLQDGYFLEYADQNLLQQELDQFDPNNYNFEDFLTTTMDHQSIPEMGDSRSVQEEDEEEEENSKTMFKGIQAELMEEESLTDLLLAAADAVDAQNHPLVSNLIQKLTNLLLCDMGSSSFNQLAWFFTQGLHYKTVGYDIAAHEMAEQDQTMNKNSLSAFLMLQQLSPYIKFAHFTANQAILEASEGEKMIHVIDFDIMEGIQWPPLMEDLAAKKQVCLLRLTAIEQGNENEQRRIEETGRRLSEFAKSINLPFKFDHMGIEKDENFEQIQVLGQTVIGNCSGILHSLSHRNSSKLETFLNGISKLSPKCVVLVEEELFKVSKAQPMSFVEFFFEAFHHFSSLSDSLLRCFSGVHENGFKQVMDEFLGTRILESVSQFPCGKNAMNLREKAFDYLKGYKKIPFSSFNCSQAKYLITLFRGDFWVQHENGTLSLCWKSRPLCSATIWVPTAKI
ncbi:nodulation-signaling pathway 2 protein-like [Cucurbita maxima]|uniref:Nodulation-signaling pathway 2 protein-like n=1 Tax=Cucurbita maxima TaxID=3661 RepID=A0A6J1KQT9_CUCMA|nr:nodulation-signaling pathway 2 protein-like [Cucurbita maxima]